MPPKKKVRFSDTHDHAGIPTKKENKEEIPFHHDTIGMHLMALRTFYRGLVKHKQSRKKREILRRPTMPEYPIDYPTSSYLYSLRKKRSKANQRHLEGNFKSNITKAEVDHNRTLATIKILAQVGFEVEDINDKLPLHHLSYVSDVFLKSFVERIRFHKDSEAFCEDEDLWDPLETTLQEWGFEGIRGIAKYFYDDFAKTVETLSDDCLCIVKVYKKQEEAEKKERKRKKKLKKCKTIPDINNDETIIEDDDHVMEIDDCLENSVPIQQ